MNVAKAAVCWRQHLDRGLDVPRYLGGLARMARTAPFLDVPAETLPHEPGRDDLSRRPGTRVTEGVESLEDGSSECWRDERSGNSRRHITEHGKTFPRYPPDVQAGVGRLLAVLSGRHGTEVD